MKNDLIATQINVLQMQDRAKHLWGDNNRLQKQIHEKESVFNKKQKKNDELISEKVIRINELETKIEELTKESKALFSERKQMNETHQSDLKTINTRQLAEVEDMQRQISVQESRLEDIVNWLDQETDKRIQREQMKENLQVLFEKHDIEIDQIKKEKAITIDKLRKEMLQNIRTVKNQMLSMNEEQLQGTTKMTVR